MLIIYFVRVYLSREEHWQQSRKMFFLRYFSLSVIKSGRISESKSRRNLFRKSQVRRKVVVQEFVTANLSVLSRFPLIASRYADTRIAPCKSMEIRKAARCVSEVTGFLRELSYYIAARRKVSVQRPGPRGGFRHFPRSIRSKVSERSRRRLTQIIAAYWYRRVYAEIRVPVDRYFPPRRNFKTILTETRKKYEVQSSNSLSEVENGRGGPIGTPDRILLFDARRIDLNAKAYHWRNFPRIPAWSGSANSWRIVHVATFLQSPPSGAFAKHERIFRRGRPAEKRRHKDRYRPICRATKLSLLC